MLKQAFHSQGSLLSSILVESNTEDLIKGTGRGILTVRYHLLKLSDFSDKWICAYACVHCHSLASYVNVQYNGYTSTKASITTQGPGKCPC